MMRQLGKKPEDSAEAGLCRARGQSSTAGSEWIRY